MAVNVTLRSNPNALTVGLSANTLPTVALVSPISGANSNNLTPTLQFIGSDADGDSLNYNVQVSPDSNFYIGGLQDSWGVANQSNFYPLGNGINTSIGHSFTATGGVLDNVKFYLKKAGSPTGNAVAKIYAHSGTYGTDSAPSEAALATSTNFNVSTLTGSFVLTTFTFTGGNKIVLTEGTRYIAVIEYSGGDVSNYVDVATDSSPSHGGNMSYYEIITPTAYDTSTTATFVGATSFSYSCSGSNRLLLVSVTNGFSASTEILGITYNGVSLTQLDTIENTDGASGVETTVYYLIAPSTGSNTLAITVSGPPEYPSVSVVSLTGVNQSTPFGTVTKTNFNSTNSSSINVTSSSGQMVIDFLGTLSANTGNSAGANQTARTTLVDTNISVASSTKIASGSSTTMSWGWDVGADRWGNHIGVAINSSGWNTTISDDVIFEVNADAGLLYNKFSDVDTGFANITNGGDTQPFTAGDTIGYTIPSNLTDSTTYYWRVRANDAVGWGAWSSTENFVATVAVGALQITATGIASVETFGSHALNRGATSRSVNSINSSEFFGTLLINRGAVSRQVTGIASSEVVNSVTINRGSVSIQGVGISTAEVFGSPVLNRGLVTVTPTSINSVEVFGTLVLNRGSVNITPTAIVSLETLGSPVLNRGAVPITLTGISTTEVFGTTTINQGQVTLAPTSIGSSEIVSSAVLLRGSVSLILTGIAPQEVFGSTTILNIKAITVNSIVSSELVNDITLNRGSVNVAPISIVPTVAFGNTSLTRGAVQINLNGLTSVETFGSPALSVGAFTINVQEIASGYASGATVVNRGAVSFSINSIQSLESFGDVTLMKEAAYINLSSIISGEVVSSVLLLRGAVSILTTGIVSLGSAGTPVVTPQAVSVLSVSTLSMETFGDVSTTKFVNVYPISTTTEELFGVIDILLGDVTITATAINSEEVVSDIQITLGEVELLINSINGAEAFGIVNIGGEQPLYVDAVATGEFVSPVAVTYVDKVIAIGVPSAELVSSVIVVPYIPTLSDIRRGITLSTTNTGAVGLPSQYFGTLPLSTSGIDLQRKRVRIKT